MTKKYLQTSRLLHNPVALGIVFCGCITLLAGCSLTQKAKAERARLKAEIELKKKRYANLKQAIFANTLRYGISSMEISELYGEPDDIFRSSSATGSFEIWTYERVSEKEEEIDWNPIRLYFDSNKLISWKY